MTGDDVREAIRQVIDPEVGVNIVDLGLVYRVELVGDVVTIVMTMTSPACPMGDYLRDQVEAAVRAAVPGLRRVEIELTWFPPWDPSMMSLVAKRQLNWNGPDDGGAGAL